MTFGIAGFVVTYLTQFGESCILGPHLLYSINDLLISEYDWVLLLLQKAQQAKEAYPLYPESFVLPEVKLTLYL